MPFGGESRRRCSGLEEGGGQAWRPSPALGSGGLVRVRSGVSFCRAQRQGGAEVRQTLNVPLQQSLLLTSPLMTKIIVFITAIDAYGSK